MKRMMAGIVLVLSSATLLAGVGTATPLSMGDQRGNDQSNSASGSGSMSFGEHGDGVGLIEFDVEGNRPAVGSLLFAAEDHHRYPHIVVRVEKIARAGFGRRSVKFAGKGTLHDVPVTVNVSAFDGNGTEKPDTFSIQCTDSAGDVIFEADGTLFSGDISVGTPSRDREGAIPTKP